MEKPICMSKPYIIKKSNRRYRPAFIVSILKEAKEKGVDKTIIDKYGLNKRVFYKWKNKQSQNEYYTRQQYGLERMKGQKFDVEARKAKMLLRRGSSKTNLTITGQDKKWNGNQLLLRDEIYKVTKEMQEQYDKVNNQRRWYMSVDIKPSKKMKQLTLNAYINK